MMRWAILGVLIAFSGGCATYSDWVDEMEYEIASGDSEAALDTLEKHLGKRRDQVLYLLNRAMLLRISGQLEDSNQVFEEAKTLIETRGIVSVSEQGGALTINDMMRSYSGAPYERALIHVYAALNYLELGQPREARVEALQLNGLLNELVNSGFHDAGFARYIGALIYETLGEWDDALIDYRKAYQAYQGYPVDYGVDVPEQLKYDLLRMTRKLGLLDEYEKYRDQWAIATDQPDSIGPEGAEVIFMLHSGFAPLKYSTNISATTSDGELVTISLPYYESREAHVTSATVRAGLRNRKVEMFENINAAAQYTLQKEMPKIMARAIARAALKHQATEAAKERDDSLGVFINVAGVLSERADTRSWSTLPNRIYLARLPLERGIHDVRVELRDRTGALITTRAYTVDLQAGEKRFISLHWIDPMDMLSTSAYAATRERRH